MKNRIMSILLALALLCAILPAATVRASAETTSGTCGDNLTWSFDSATGTLTIQGSGEMNDYGYVMAPWGELRDSIKKVTIGNGVTTIGSEAFSNCTSLTSVVIGSSVTSIGNRAFDSCTALTSVTIPNSVTSIGFYAFASCDSLTKITVASGNPNYSSDSSGVLFNKNKTELICCPGGFSGSYAIPSSVTSIGKGAFSRCASLTSVVIGSSVTSIGSYAFCNCNSLTSVTIGNSVTSIGENAFSSCASLTSVTIGSSVTSIGSDAFSDCFSLTSLTIPNSVTSIGSYAFNNCTSLTSLTIGSGVTSIGEDPFYGCGSLTKITVASGNPNYSSDSSGVLFNKNKTELICCPGGFSGSYTIPSSVTSIGKSAFGACTSLTSVTIPDSVTSIGDDAFFCCYSLTSVTIPSSVTGIGKSAFTNCTSLTSVTIPNSVKSIGDYAFYNCESLTSVTIGNSVTSIGENAFSSCASLTSVTIGSSVTSIGDYAFYGCTSLTSVTIPNSVTSIGFYAFASCNSLTKITVASGNPNYCSDSHGVLFNKNKTELIQCPGGYQGSYAISSSVTSIDAWAFESCTALTSVTIGNNVESIGDDAFFNCTSLTSVSIPDSVTSIGDEAFGSCSEDLVIYGVAGSAAETYANENDIPFVALAAPKITTQPSNASVALGKTATFKVVATGSNLSYQWQYKRAGASSWTDWSGKTSATLTVTAASNNNGCQYRCLVSNPLGTKTSNAATLTVVTVSKPTITAQPKNATAANGESATFSVTAAGEGTLTYQWQFKRSGATSWSNWSGKTAASLVVTAGSNNNGCQYRCAVTNAGGTTYSNAATLTVTVAKPVITTQPKSVSLAAGECMTFSCAATGEGTLSYQWQYKRAGATAWSNWSGKTDTILNVVAGSNNSGCQYRCAVTNAGGTTYTNAATLTVTSSHNCPGAAFTDMPAKGTIEHTAIDWAIRSGVTKGTSATKFSPSMTVTRSQVVTFLWRACGSPEPKTTKNPFTDVKTTDWFYKAVLWAVEQGITNGTSANKFSPNTVCSRSQTLTFLYRQQGSPAVGSVTVPYTDVTAGAFYENAMKWAYSNGIDKGVTATTFAPNANCVRVSNVVFLYRAITGQGRLK